MRLAGFLISVAGWTIVLTAVVLFSLPALRTGFVLAGVAVEALGWVLVIRSHLGTRRGAA